MQIESYAPVSSAEKVQGTLVLDSFIHAVTWHEVINVIHQWSAERESRYVCICNVHSVVTARQNPTFQQALNDADMATPDGMPVAWMLRQMGFPNQQRINGPDLMWQYCQHAERHQASLFLYGSAQNTLDLLQQKLHIAFPKLRIAGSYSPPYRPMTREEEIEMCKLINGSGASVVFVSLGCPKQEFWMAQHRGKIHAVMIGVGAAFDYHAGTIKRAPLWMQHSGLEWFYRLCSEPRRLWKRYVSTNSLFMITAGWQVIVYKLKNHFSIHN